MDSPQSPSAVERTAPKDADREMAQLRGRLDVVETIVVRIIVVAAAVATVLWLSANNSDDDVVRGPAIWPVVAGLALTAALVCGSTVPDLWRRR